MNGIVNGDIIEFKKNDFLEKTFNEQRHIITLPVSIKEHSTFQFYTDMYKLFDLFLEKVPQFAITIEKINFYDQNTSPLGHEVTIVTNKIIPTEIANFTNNGSYILLNSLFNYDRFSFFRKASIKKVDNDNRYKILFTNENGVVNENIQLVYNPFVKLPIRSWSDYTENGTTRTDIIPDYSVKIDEDTNIWKDYELYKEFPFINNTHYIYENIYFSVEPDMKDSTTYEYFKNFDFNRRFQLNNYIADNILQQNKC